MQPNISEIECPVCGNATLISDEVKAAFFEIIDHPDFLLAASGDEEVDDEGNNDEASDGRIEHSRRDVVVRETTEGEEEDTEPRETAEEQSGEMNENKYEDFEEDQLREDDKTSFSFEYLTQLPCQEHPEELNTHYSPILKRLLCPQCIIEFQPKKIEHNAKPIRRSHGLILQALDDLISTVEVGRQLADNRVGKLQIKADQMRLAVDSLRNRIELKFEEVAQVVDDLKRDVLKKFDNRWQDVFRGVEDSAKDLETRIEKFEEALAEITRIRTKSSKANEELMEFLFNNQAQVEELTAQGKDAAEDLYVTAFDNLNSQIDSRLNRSMEVSQMSVFLPLRDYFNDILSLDPPKPAVSRKQSKPKSISPSAKNSTPDKLPADHNPKQKSLMKEIKSKLEKYKRARKESSDDQEEEVTWQPQKSRARMADNYTLPKDYKPSGLTYREGVGRRKPSPDSYIDQQSSDAYDKDQSNDAGSYANYQYGQRDRLMNRHEAPSQYFSTKNKFEKKDHHRNYQGYESLKQSYGKPELGSRSQQFKVDSGYQRGLQSTKHAGQSSSFVGEEADQRRNSNWYFESMKTINDLKNFRDNVRSKLNVSTPYSGRPQLKFSTPRYGIH